MMVVLQTTPGYRRCQLGLWTFRRQSAHTFVGTDRTWIRSKDTTFPFHRCLWSPTCAQQPTGHHSSHISMWLDSVNRIVATFILVSCNQRWSPHYACTVSQKKTTPLNIVLHNFGKSLPIFRILLMLNSAAEGLIKKFAKNLSHLWHFKHVFIISFKNWNVQILLFSVFSHWWCSCAKYKTRKPSCRRQTRVMLPQASRGVARLLYT